MKKPNPLLKAAIFEIVDNQLRENDPPETKQTLQRLQNMGISEEDARACIARVVCFEIYDIMKRGEMFNRERYVGRLERLPEEDE